MCFNYVLVPQLGYYTDDLQRMFATCASKTVCLLLCNVLAAVLISCSEKDRTRIVCIYVLILWTCNGLFVPL